MAEIIDLWPDKIAVAKLITPVTILRQQASLLGKKTKNIVQGEVANWKLNIGAEYDFQYVFYIGAPALDNYRYRLLGIFYNVSALYPVIIDVEDEEIQKEIPSKFKYGEKIFGPSTKERISVKANSEEEFLDILKAIFNSAKVLRVISVLLSQSDPSYDPSLKEEEIPQ